MVGQIFALSKLMVAWSGKGFPEFISDALAYAKRLSKRIGRRRRQGKHNKVIPSNYDRYAWVQLVQFLVFRSCKKLSRHLPSWSKTVLKEAIIRLMFKDCAIDFDQLARVMREISPDKP